MSDPDQTGEQFDDEELWGEELPPDRPVGVEPDDWTEDAEDEEDAGDEDADDFAAYDRDETGPLAPDDEFSGDETTRDIVTERVPLPAEEAALHLDPGGEDDDV